MITERLKNFVAKKQEEYNKSKIEQEKKLEEMKKDPMYQKINLLVSCFLTGAICSIPAFGLGFIFGMLWAMGKI